MQALLDKDGGNLQAAVMNDPGLNFIVEARRGIQVMNAARSQIAQVFQRLGSLEMGVRSSVGVVEVVVDGVTAAGRVSVAGPPRRRNISGAARSRASPG